MTKILYVEDNPDNVYMLTRRLKKKGFELIIAGDGQEGIDKAIEEKNIKLSKLILYFIILLKKCH